MVVDIVRNDSNEIVCFATSVSLPSVRFACQKYGEVDMPLSSHLHAAGHTM